jgi:hypothetical protein
MPAPRGDWQALITGHSAQIRAERGRLEGRLCLLVRLMKPQSSAVQQIREGYQTAYSRDLDQHMIVGEGRESVEPRHLEKSGPELGRPGPHVF